MTDSNTRGRRKVRVGVVVSDARDKTVTVEVPDQQTLNALLTRVAGVSDVFAVERVSARRSRKSNQS